MTASVVLSDLYAKHSKDIDGSIAQKVLSFFDKLQSDPKSPALKVKTPKGVKDKYIKIARVDLYWRAVMIELKPERSYAIVAIMQHDPAYDLARSLGYNVNEVTGALEVTDLAALADAISVVPAPSPGSPHADHALFAALGIKAKDLESFGMSGEIIDAVLRITSIDQLLEFVDALPKNLQGVLLDLGEGRNMEDVWAEFISDVDGPVDTDDIETAAKSKASRIMFTDGSPDELRAVLEGDFKRWRIWLHPLQRKLAYHDGWNGPARVTGGAGTGKTVTVLHRARHLAKRLESAPANERVLLTMYNRNLGPELESQLVELSGSRIRDRVDVISIDRLIFKILQELDPLTSGTPSMKLVDDSHPSVSNAIDRALTQEKSERDAEFILGEWNALVLAQGITAKDQYLKATRAGRSVRLTRPERAEVWNVIERFVSDLRLSGSMTYTQAASRAANLVQAAGDTRKKTYRYAAIDEAQDLHPAHWRFLRALVPPGQDDLFIAGDAHQRLYGAPVRLSSCGINIVGRSRRLTVNYRTSRQILAWCVAVDRGEPVDDLDGGTEDLAGARSEFSGPQPVRQSYQSSYAETQGTAQLLTDWKGAEIDWRDMAVMHRYANGAEKLAKELDDIGVPAVVLGGTSDLETLGDRVRVMTLHRSKGLEFRAVAIVGVSAASVPPKPVQQSTGEARKQGYVSDRNLLYVGASRARERLSISWTSEPSELIPDVANVVK